MVFSFFPLVLPSSKTRLCGLFRAWEVGSVVLFPSDGQIVGTSPARNNSEKTTPQSIRVSLRTAPPCDPDATDAEQFDLYDAGACTYFGRITKSDTVALIKVFKDAVHEGPNDLFVIYESLEFFPKDVLSEELVAMLHNALEERDYLLLRWILASQ